MRKMFTIFALLVLIGGPAAIAQTGGRTGSSRDGTSNAGTSDKAGQIEAPVGHRQPRAGDLPPNVADDPTHLDAEDAALDRRIKSICRGC
jgi:hypothetical protein